MRPKIFFVHSGNETFVKLDCEILSGMAEVRDYYARRKFPAGLTHFWRGIKSSDIVFCWFASWNSFWVLLFAKLLRRPSLLVIGGYDVANLPEADYGSQRGGLEKWISRWAMGLATILLPFSFASQREAVKNAGIASERMKVVYIGVPDLFGELQDKPREQMALTVGKVERSNLKRKGLEPFVRAAALLPDVQFILVGAWADDSINYLRSIASSNVRFTGRASDQELVEYYHRASVYVQASLHEGFGLSVAEAMLAGCIPVTTCVGSLPEVVGEYGGFYCGSADVSAIADAITFALNAPGSARQQARDRILSEFPINNRRKLLEQSVHSVSPRGTRASHD
ncbi:MAG: glycosyltransferase family 4 protein [Chloroflexota bacterium]